MYVKQRFSGKLLFESVALICMMCGTVLGYISVHNEQQDVQQPLSSTRLDNTSKHTGWPFTTRTHYTTNIMEEQTSIARAKTKGSFIDLEAICLYILELIELACLCFILLVLLVILCPLVPLFLVLLGTIFFSTLFAIFLLPPLIVVTPPTQTQQQPAVVIPVIPVIPIPTRPPIPPPFTSIPAR